MLHRFARIGPALLLLGAAFFAGALVAIHRGWGSPLAHLTVINNSESEVRSIVVEYKSCGYMGTIVGRTLAPHAKSRLSFPTCGEGSYRLRAFLESGAELVGTEGYIESGYRITEFVERAAIRSEMHGFHY